MSTCLRKIDHLNRIDDVYFESNRPSQLYIQLREKSLHI